MAIEESKVEAIFFAALEKQSPDDRVAYLDEVCANDPLLRQRVEALLNARPKLGNFLQGHAADMVATTLSPPTAERPGTQIGPYKLLQQIGEGGMGTVYMAEQEQPVRRKVALKVIKPGMDSGQIIARFEAERQALAMMDHVNIARVLDAGTIGGNPKFEARNPNQIRTAKSKTPNEPCVGNLVVVNPGFDLNSNFEIRASDFQSSPGRPYFVMELVNGVSITKYCDDNHLTPRQRLELFVPVCHAIQHAHQKGIIHRDIKPSNVMVTLYDGKPVPKVIDFGVAKATEQKLTERTLFTQFGTIVGTLEYMSPEQAEMSALGIDTRSDIYSLGVLLYELLTGNTPLTRKRIKDAAYTEILRIIKEEEPQKPSTRLTDSGEALASISAQRKTEPVKLSKLMRGELDWIVMKCLEKDRNRRYETASAFAADVHRYLNDEPVQACRPSTAYRLRKFVRRNKGQVLVGLTIMVMLLAGTAISMALALWARQEAAAAVTARLDEAKERDKAEKALAAEAKERQRAEKEEAEVKKQWDRAEKQLLRAEWLLYASQITLAQQAWESNNGFLANHYLESCRRDFRGWEHDYLFTLFNRNQQTFRGHTEEVSSVTLSPDGNRIVSGSHDGTVKVWDVATGQNTLTLNRHDLPMNTGPVLSVALSLDGKRIVSGNWDTMGESMTVWDADTGERILAIRHHPGAVHGVALSPDGKHIFSSCWHGHVSGSINGTVKVCDADTGQETLTLKGDTMAVYGLALSPDGKRIVGGSSDGTVKVWDAATGQETLTLKGHTNAVYSVVFSTDGKRIVSGGHDATVKVWDAATGQETLTLRGHTSGVAGVALSLDGTRIVSGSHDGTLKVWDADMGYETKTLKGHTSGITGVALSTDGKRIVSGSSDKTVKVWDAAVAQETPTLKGHAGPVRCVALSSDGKRIVSGSDDKTLKIWDGATGQETLTLKGHTGLVLSVALSPDGKRIVSGGEDNTVKVWDAATGLEIWTLNGHTFGVTSVTVSRSGRLIVSGSYDGTLKIWNAATSQETRTLKGHTSRVTSVALSPDGKRIVSGSWDNTVKVWDAATGEETLTLKGHTGLVYSVALSPDGKRIVSGSEDKTVKVWDAATGQETWTLNGHTFGVSSVAFSPDGTRIVSGAHDATVKVWDAATGYETMILKGHTLLVTSVALSLDGKWIVSGSVDGTVKLWDASMSAPARAVELAK